MEPEGLLPCSQGPSTGPYPEPDQSSPYHSILFLLLTFHVPNHMSIFHSLGRLFKESAQVRGPFWHFVINLFFYREELLSPLPTPKLEGHPLSAVRDCLFSIFAASLHIWRPSPPSATWGRAMPWWQEIRLTWISRRMDDKITGLNLSLESQARYKSWSVTPSLDDQLVGVLSYCCQFGCRVTKAK
jgi:hypothetical protein